MAFFSSNDISASALSAQRLRMDVIAENIANANTTRAKDGGPYRRKTVTFEERPNVTKFSSSLNDALSKTVEGKGVRVRRIAEDGSPGPMVYDPSHPDADDEGYVEMSNVNIVTEMVNMISASRSYEANVTALATAKTMTAKTLEIGR